MTYKNLLKIIPTLQGTVLLGENAKELKKKKKNLVGLGIKNIIGVQLIKETAKFTG